MSSQDKNLPYEILMLSHFGFKYCTVGQNNFGNKIPFSSYKTKDFKSTINFGLHLALFSLPIEREAY